MSNPWMNITMNRLTVRACLHRIVTVVYQYMFIFLNQRKANHSTALGAYVLTAQGAAKEPAIIDACCSRDRDMGQVEITRKLRTPTCFSTSRRIGFGFVGSLTRKLVII